MPIFVKASVRGGNAVKAYARNYTKATAQHRLFQKVLRKGAHHKRAAKAFNRTSAELGYANMMGDRKRALQLNKRMRFLKSYVR